MEQVEVEITGMVITQRYGTLNTGDIIRTDAAFAKHLVEDAQGAKYTTPKAAAGAGEGSDAGAKLSKGLTVEQIKDALTAKGVAIPPDAKKADLQDLLDAPAN